MSEKEQVRLKHIRRLIDTFISDVHIRTKMRPEEQITPAIYLRLNEQGERDYYIVLYFTIYTEGVSMVETFLEQYLRDNGITELIEIREEMLEGE